MDVPSIEIFSWNENFATGIPEIDQQHRTLIGLINQLVSHLAYQSDAPTLTPLFDQLTAYAAQHFTFEEAIWRQYLPEDPWETRHVHAHTRFVDEVNRLMAQADPKNHEMIIEEIVAFLTRWLAVHILAADRRLAKVVLALPSSISLAQPKSVTNDEMAGATQVLIDTVMAMYENLASRTMQLTREMNRRRSVEQELQVLEISRLREGKLRLVQEEFELQAVLQQVSGWVSASAEIKGLTLGIDIEPSLRKTFRGDPLRLRQILLNLIDNALKYTELGHILMRVRLEEDTTQDCLLRFEIEDSGIGIAPAKQSGLFERLDNTSGANVFRYGGRGLGLSIARQLTQLMGGTIGVNSQPGIGSLFWFTVRLEKIEPGAEALTAPPHPSRDDLAERTHPTPSIAAQAPPARHTIGVGSAIPATRRTRATILCVDDEPINLDVLRETLHQDYSLIFTRNGKDALRAARKHGPALILLDIQMPDMDGYEVCRRLKTEPATEDIPVIFVTSQSEQFNENAGFDVGGVDYITKPITPLILQARVRNHLSLVRSSRLETSYRDAIYMLAEAGHHSDTDTGSHIWRMAAYSRALAEALGWSAERCELLELAATMHDTGKLGISDSILKKPGTLDAQEFAVMKTHSRIGFGILSRSHAPVFQLAAEIALHHHERWDGSGYPAGLSGEGIPESARIVAIADVFDALSKRRPYKEPWPMDRILTHMRDNAGSHFDPRLLQVFLDIMPTIMSLRDLWEKGD